MTHRTAFIIISLLTFNFQLSTHTACGTPQPVKTAGGAVFEISPEIVSARVDTLIDVGRLHEGEVLKYDARVLNGGPEPLVITDVTASCGCTRVEWDKRPIAPGAEGLFSLRFDSRGMLGMQMKLVELRTSAGEHPFRLMLRVEVVDDNP